MLWGAERNPELMRIYLGTIFPPFWRRELDIENPEVVCQCLRTGAYLHSRGPIAVQECQCLGTGGILKALKIIRKGRDGGDMTHYRFNCIQVVSTVCQSMS